MNQYEYLFKEFDIDFTDTRRRQCLIRGLNEAGKEGWECIDAEMVNGTAVPYWSCLMKRQIPKPSYNQHDS